jgi:hypothetical protein
MATTTEIKDYRKTFRADPLETGLRHSPPENAWYSVASGRITTLFANADESAHPAQEENCSETTIVVYSGMLHSWINPRPTPNVVPVCGLWSSAERGSTSGLLYLTYRLLETQCQSKSTLFLDNPEPWTDCLRQLRASLLGSHANYQIGKTFANCLKSYSELSLPSVETTADLLARVRAHLSLNTTELAQSLRTERQNIYNWMKASHTPRPESRQRLMTLAHLAQTWTQLCHEPLQDLKTALIEGSWTLLDLLSAPDLNEIRIKRVLAKLADRRKTDAESKTTEAEKSIHEIARERGWESVDPEIREQTIRCLSLGRGG